MTTESGREDVDPRPGQEIDRYTIGPRIGRGGMGAVYEARHTRLARRVAIKFLLPNMAERADVLRRFENEAVAAGGLEHPNLVAVIDLGRAPDGAPYLVMEYLAGEDCARLLRRTGQLPVGRAVNIALQACRGVAAAHDAGIVHRDLKPENLFLTDPGDGSDQIKVLDFGIAKLQPIEGQAGTRTGATFGTTYYMSPEQARGASEVDQRTDVWSLGVVLFELLSGRKPYDGEQPLSVIHQILNASPPALSTLRPGLPRGLADVVAHAMRKDVGERFPSIRAFAAALAPFAGRAAVADARGAAASTGPTVVTGEAPGRRPRGRRVGTILALGMAVAVVTISIVSARNRAPAPLVAVPEAVSPAPPVVVAPPPKPSEVSGASEQVAVPAPPELAEPARVNHRAEPRPPKTHATVGTSPPPAVKLDPNPY